MIFCWYDGACEPVNPGGHAAWGAIIKAQSKVIWEGSGYVGHGPEMSNNVAEYCGVISVLKHLRMTDYWMKQITIYGDNKMSINQLAGRWKAKGGLYYPYYKEAMLLVREFPDIQFIWIPRELNSRADELSKRPLIEHWRR